MKTSEQTDLISAALVKAQTVIKTAKKDASNPFFKSNYADLESVTEAVRPALVAHGLAVVQGGVFVDGQWMLASRLTHVSGQWYETYFPLVAKDATAQAMGSAMSYAKRYGLQALTGVVSANEDDDAEVAVGRGEVKPFPAPRLSTPPAAVASGNGKNGHYTFTFGKFKGKTLSEVPANELSGYADFLEKSDRPSDSSRGAVFAIRSFLNPTKHDFSGVTMEEPSPASEDLPF